MSSTDRAGFRPPSALPPSRGDATGPQSSTPSTPQTHWPSSGPALKGAGTPGQADTKALPSNSGTPDGKSISSFRVSVGTPSADVVSELNRALVELVSLVPQDGKQASQKHKKQFEGKLQAFAALATTSRDAALHTLVKSFEMLAVHTDPRDHRTSLFSAVAERVFLALDVGGDIANLNAALAAIPGGDVLAASTAKAALPEQMMRALARAVGAATPGLFGEEVPRTHLDALRTRVTGGAASEKTGEWLRGMTQGLFDGVLGNGHLRPSKFPTSIGKLLVTWAGESLRTLSGEQLAGMARGVLNGLPPPYWAYLVTLMNGLPAPQVGVVAAAAAGSKYGLFEGAVLANHVKGLAPLYEDLAPLRRTAFFCGMATHVPPEGRVNLVTQVAKLARGLKAHPIPILVKEIRLGATLASDPFAEFAHAGGEEGRLERLETVLQIPGVARAEHADHLAKLVDRGEIPRARAEALSDRIPAFVLKLLPARLEAAGQALRQRIADALATLDGVSDDELVSDKSVAQMNASFLALDEACDTYARDAGFAAYMEEGEGVSNKVPLSPIERLYAAQAALDKDYYKFDFMLRTEVAVPPGLLPEAVPQHLSALARLRRHVQPPESKGDADRIHQLARAQVAAKLTSFVDAFRSMPAGAGVPWPMKLEPEQPPPATSKAAAVRDSKEATDTKAGPPKAVSQEVPPSRSTTTAAVRPLDEDGD